jgi:hypothetical protein
MTTEAFVEYLNEHLIDAHPEAFADVDIRAWIYGPGIPDNCPKVVSTRFTAVDQEVHAFNGGATAASLKTSGWTTHEWLRFIYQLPEDITVERMSDLDKSFHFTGIGNCEIADAWYELAVKRQYATAYADMETFLCSVGRRKFLTPLYKAMMQTNQSEMAKRIYAKARPGYHYVAQNTLDELVGN